MKVPATRLQIRKGRHRGGLFKVAERARDFTRHSLYAYAYLKILMAPLSLRSPVLVCGYFDFSHGIMLNSKFCHFFPPEAASHIFTHRAQYTRRLPSGIYAEHTYMSLCDV